MADAQHLYYLTKDDASQVVPVRDRTSAHRIDTASSCELNGRLSLRVFGEISARKRRLCHSPTVTGCNLCSRSVLSPMFPAATLELGGRAEAGHDLLQSLQRAVETATHHFRAWWSRTTGRHERGPKVTTCDLLLDPYKAY